MRESVIEDFLSTKVRELGGKTIKLNAKLYVGIPDRAVLLPGASLVFVETKSIAGRMSAQQRRWWRMLRDLGFDVQVLDTHKAVLDYLDEYARQTAVQKPAPMADRLVELDVKDAPALACLDAEGEDAPR
jgi:hypothetical protein